jgi:hypothetical protein
MKNMKKLEKLWMNLMAFKADDRAYAPVVMLIISVIVGFLAIAVLVPSGMITTALLNTTIASMSAYTGTVKTTVIALFTNIFAGFNILSISPIVMAAGAIVTILVVAFTVYATRE